MEQGRGQGVAGAGQASQSRTSALSGVNMAIKKIQLRPGVNRENTRYTTEGGWFFSDKVRFRQGTPEKIGGWVRYIVTQFLGICRSLWPWVSFGGASYLGAGTNLKYYVNLGGAYNDITPIRETTAAGAVTFAATTGSATITATDIAHGCVTGDFVTFSGAVSLGGNITAAVLNQEYQVIVNGVDTYTFTATATANASDTGNGGAAVVAAYQLNVGSEIQVPLSGWGAGAWGAGAWGIGGTSVTSLRIWTAYNFGEDLLINPKGGGIYYWDSSAGTGTRAVNISTLTGASDTPSKANLILVSDASRFVLALGTTDYGSSVLDPMLLRWSDQESAANWTPSATGQAGSLKLSHGSAIQAVAQVRQEILIWTDVSLYSLQYLGPPIVWGSQLLADNISIVSDRSWATAAGVTYWMGDEKFYMFDGRTQTLNCDLKNYVFTDFNFEQKEQVFASTVEQFNEVWWFYCSAGSTTVDRYVVYNYMEKIWYYGNMARTAWLDANIISDVPIAADYNRRLLSHETGADDYATETPLPITAYITSSEFDIDDGDRFSFVWRVLPDVTFRGSTAASPKIDLTLMPLQNSGSGYNNPMSVAGNSEQPVTRTATVPIEEFTGQVNIRVRGRQMAMKIASDDLGVQWQAGSMRFDIRPDGRAGTR